MTDSAPKALKCPNCTERFSGENRQALLKAHVREAHRQEHVSRPDAINVTTPAFRPMTEVLWEKVDRLKARAKRLEEVKRAALDLVGTSAPAPPEGAHWIVPVECMRALGAALAATSK